MARIGARIPTVSKFFVLASVVSFFLTCLSRLGFSHRLQILLGWVTFLFRIHSFTALLLIVGFLVHFGSSLENQVGSRPFGSLLVSVTLLTATIHLLLFVLNYITGFFTMEPNIIAWTVIQVIAMGHYHCKPSTPIHTRFKLYGRHLPILVPAVVILLRLLFFGPAWGTHVLTTLIDFLLASALSVVGCRILFGARVSQSSSLMDGLPLPAVFTSQQTPILFGATEEEAKRRRALAEAALEKQLELLSRSGGVKSVSETINTGV